jgi:stage III sporulation protein AB
MIRLIGILLLLAGSTGMGLAFCHEQNERLRYLKLIREIFADIQKEMEYLKSTMPEICLSLSRRNSALSEAFGDIYQEAELSNGCYFNEIWERHFRDKLKKVPLKESEKEMLIFFPESLIFRDSGGQADGMRKYINEISKYIEEIEGQIKNKNRVIMCLGIMAGMIAIVILY